MPERARCPVRSGPIDAPGIRTGLTRRDVLREAVLDHRGRLGVAALLFSLHQAGEALVPVLIGVVIDRAVTDAAGGVGELVLWLAVLGAVFATLSLSYRIGARRAEAAAEWAAHGLRLQITRRVLHPRGGAETGRLPGALAGIATSDA